MRFFPNSAALFDLGALRRRIVVGALLLAGACGSAFYATGELPEWVREVIGGSAIESALYRLMEIPEIKVLYPRPPAEARGELSNLLAKTPCGRRVIRATRPSGRAVARFYGRRVRLEALRCPCAGYACSRARAR